MPKRADPEISAAELLERRRAQNRLAQHRFRQKKLAAQGQAKASTSSKSPEVPGGSTTSISPESSPEIIAQAAAPGFGNIQFQTLNQPAQSFSPSSHAAFPFAELFESSTGSIPSTSVLPISTSTSPPELYPYNISHESSSNSTRSEGSSSPSSSETTMDSGEGSFDVNNLPQDGLEVICSPTQSNDLNSTFGTKYDPPNLCPLNDCSGNDSSGKSATKMTDAYLFMEVAQTLTQEKGMLAIILLQTGSPSLAALRATFWNPSTDQRFAAKFPFAKAFYHNAVTLGFLDNDLRTCAGMSSIAKIWPLRSVPVLEGDAFTGPASDSELPVSQGPWYMPTALTSTSEQRRAQQLRENPHMHPTKLQMEHPHSLLIDILPWPHVRDALIRLCLAGITSGHEIKCDMIGKDFDCTGDGHVFTIHGDDPCDPESWEVSESFAKRWSVVLDKKIIKRTNFWRRMRGLPNLELGDEKSQSQWIANALLGKSSNFL